MLEEDLGPLDEFIVTREPTVKERPTFTPGCSATWRTMASTSDSTCGGVVARRPTR